MLNRINSYKIIRKTHFITSVLIFALSLMYIITGFITSKHDWFDVGKDVKFSQSYPINFLPDTTNLRNLGKEIKREFNLSGRMNYNKNKKGEISFNIFRPGIVQHVKINKDLESLTITKTERKTFYEINKRIHRIHGFEGGPLYFFWGILLDLTAVSIIVFSVTGIFLWYRARKFYKFGWFILAPVFILGIIVFIFLKF